MGIIHLYCKDFEICVFPRKRVDFVIMYSFFTEWSLLTVYSWFYHVRKHFWKPRMLHKSLYVQRIQFSNYDSPRILLGFCVIVQFLKIHCFIFYVQICGYLWWEDYSKINCSIINRRHRISQWLVTHHYFSKSQLNPAPFLYTMIQCTLHSRSQISFGAMAFCYLRIPYYIVHLRRAEILFNFLPFVTWAISTILGTIDASKYALISIDRIQGFKQFRQTPTLGILQMHLL